MTDRPDITTRADCEALVRAFYGQALTDPLIGYLFTDVAHMDLDEHIPVITSFWETILLGAKSYGGGAFGPHLRLHELAPMQPGHFERWLTLWRQTVDAQFAGPVAEQAKHHAQRVARAFNARLQGLSSPPNAGPLVVSLHGPAAA